MNNILRHATEREKAAVTLVLAELRNARGQHPDFKSTHEGYAVILEELDESWDFIKQDRGIDAIKAEIVAVAAMAIRFMTDL